MKIKSLIATLSIMAIATSSCNILNKMNKQTSGSDAASSSSRTTSATVNSSENDTASLKVLEGEWSIIDVLGKEVVVNGENHPKLTITPTLGGLLEVIGYNGCNYLNGHWNLRDNRIIPAGEFISTLKSCPDAPYEFSVNQALAQAASYQLTDGSNVTLLSASGSPVMKLRKRGLGFLNGAWRVTSIDAQPVTANIYIVIDVDEAKVHGNAGCNLLNGEIVVNLDKGDGIEFRNLVTTRMTCPDIAVERQFLLALENVATASKGADIDKAVLNNSSDKPVVTLERLSADQLKALSDE